jgi:hypothetical protein
MSEGQDHLTTMVERSTLDFLNHRLTSARDETMIDCLGAPIFPLSTLDDPSRASSRVQALMTKGECGGCLYTGIRPAVLALTSILYRVFEDEPELAGRLRCAAMLHVRLRLPTSGKLSTKPSNHAWGTAADFYLEGERALGDTGKFVPKWVVVLARHFNQAGWFSGLGFADAMHFEVADETIQDWRQSGKFEVLASSK